MSITTCFPVGSASDNNYLNNNNNNEQTNSNLINSLNSASNQSIYRNKLTNHQTDLSTNLNSNNVIQNSKSDLMISGFDSFPLSRTTTPISYLTNSSLDNYFNNTNSTLSTPNPQLNLLSTNSRCHSSNSNCSTNSKLNNHNNLTSSRPASSFDNFLIINNDSNDSTTHQVSSQQRTTSISNPGHHPASVVSYYPHIILNENNYPNNLNGLSNLSTNDLNVQQTNATSAIHHSSNFNQQSTVKEEFLENSNYQSAIGFNNDPLSNSTNNNLNGMNNLSNSLNRLNTNTDNEIQSSNNLDFSSTSNNKTGTKKRRNKVQGPASRPQCAECGKDFSNQSALSKHKLTHSDERKFVCTLCKKCNFKRQDHLNGHLYTHRDKKPYQCDIKNCEKTYCDARSLKRHKENHHHILCSLALPLLGKNLSSDLASNIINAVKTSDGSRIQYAPASNDNEQAELDLSNAVINPSLLNLADRSQSELLQLITQVDGNGNTNALSVLQQIAEQQSNQVECPTCQKKFKNLPALNGHMRLHGGYVRGSQPINNQQNQNNQQRTNNQSINQSVTNSENNDKNEQPIDLIKKEDLFVDLTNNQTNSHSPSQQTNNDSNTIKDKIRKHIANTPVIMENPEANRFQMINNNRVQYYPDETPNNLLSTSVINSNHNNTSPLVDHLQLDSNSPINSEAIIHEQDLLNNNSQITADKQIVHENSWFEDRNNVLQLKEQLQQQFRAPPNKIVQQTNNLTNNSLSGNSTLNRCPTIPAHVFSGEKFRRHSDSTAEILNQNNNNPNYNNPHHMQQSNNNGLIINQSLNNTQINQNSIQQQPVHSNTHSNGQGMTNTLHNQQHIQSVDYHESVNNQIENSNNLINFDFLKRKPNRSESETSANETMDTLPESQLINSSSNYLSTNNHNLPTNHQQLFYNNNCNNNNLAYQSHSVPTTPTVVVNSNSDQNFFNHRLDLNNVNQQLSHTSYADQLSNQQISHHQSQHSTQHLNQSQHQQHSLPCTPKQPTSFTFSPHQVQHYQQQSYHNQNNYCSSPNTPITPVTPTTTNQYQQDNLILQQRPTNIHQQAIQSNNLNTLNSGHKNLYPNVEFNNNTICSRDKFSNHQSNYGMISNHQFLNDDLNNTSYSMMNDDFMVSEANYNEQQQFISSNCNQQLSNNLDNTQRNLNYQQQLNNSNNVVCSNSNYSQTSQISNASNVIMSNYANTDTFCESDNHLNKNNMPSNCNPLNNMLNEELTKKNSLQNNNNLISNLATNLPINCTTSNAIEKPSYTRVTLRSVSPNLVIETDSFKNSTADDSRNSNPNEDVDDEDDDVFLKPTDINQAQITSPKTNCLNNNSNKKLKPYNNSSSNGTYLAGSSSLVNLPQVDFTHPQQPKLVVPVTIHSNKDDNRKEESHINDINFNQIKISSLDKEKQLELTNQNMNFFDQKNNNKQMNRTSSPKRTKHRPSPLHIPPHVNARIHKSSRLLINDGSNLPPPYTPPPMLSPVRTSSSYYWYILNGNLTPKTITNFFGSRKNLEQQQSILNQAAVLNQQSIVNKNRSFDFFNESNNYISTPSTAYESLDSSLPTVETTFDFSSYSSANAHVNIGVQYQARIPSCNPNKEDAKLHYKNERAFKVWSPSILDKITLSNNKDDLKQCKVISNSKRKTNLMKELELYLELSCSACVNGNGRNKEYAYHILYQNNGDLNKSIKQLLNAQPVIKPDHPLYNYKYAETDEWTCDEIQSYYDALLKYDKDFLTISKQLDNKSVKQCIEFYYLWKKVCSEEYKKHRTLRRKKEQEGIFCISSGK